MYFGDWTSWPGRTRTRSFSVADDALANVDEVDQATTNLFCSGHSFLADGRLLIAGGRIGGQSNLPSDHDVHPGHEPGERACWHFNPRARTFTRAASLNFQPGGNDLQKGGGRWYPTLVTLGSGAVFATAGHPAEDDDFESRHNNHTPEIYSGNTWTLLVEGADRTAPAGYRTDDYPRGHLLADGTIAYDTVGLHPELIEVVPRSYDPDTGKWAGLPSFPIPDSFYSRGSAATSVLLPLLPSDGYSARVLAVNGTAAFRRHVGASEANWVEVPDRQGPAAGRSRKAGCAVLLPTGRVLVCGGVENSRSENASEVLDAELYDPGIDWATGIYLDVDTDAEHVGSWIDLGDDGRAVVPRGYHSTALLLPDGRVWTGGSTEPESEHLADVEHRIEIYSPPYRDQPQLSLAGVPATIAYGQQFEIDVSGGSGAAVERVALMRCGCVTHGFDPDQRYVGLELDPNSMTVTAPPNGRIAPPGIYMLWAIDSDDVPCERARFVRLGRQKLDITLERQTLSLPEAQAEGTLPALFPRAFDVVLDGFMPHETGTPPLEPEVSLRWADGAGSVDHLSYGAPVVGYEDPSRPLDRTQRIRFTYDLAVADLALFDDVPDSPQGRDVIVRATWRAYAIERNIRLTLRPNPRMQDGDTFYLSDDVRVFQARPGDTVAPGAIAHGGDPLAFINDVVDAYNAEEVGEEHPFLDLETVQALAPIELASHVNDVPVHNFAIAKVRLKAPVGQQAAGVRVFFRLFPTWTTGFEYSGQATRGSVRGRTPRRCSGRSTARSARSRSSPPPATRGSSRRAMPRSMPRPSRAPTTRRTTRTSAAGST